MMQIILRFISAIYVILIIVPLYLAVSVCICVFSVFNNFTYANFKDYEPPSEIPNGVGMEYYGVIKVWMLLITPIIQLPIEFYQGIRKIKF